MDVPLLHFTPLSAVVQAQIFVQQNVSTLARKLEPDLKYIHRYIHVFIRVEIQTSVLKDPIIKCLLATLGT